MRWAQGRASSGVVGRQAKTRRRLGVSETPLTWYGPTMARSRRWGSVVTPYPSPIWVSARVWSTGRIRSSTGPSNRLRNAAVTRCGPASRWIESLVSRMPLGSDSVIQRSMLSSATRSPSIEISNCSWSEVRPYSSPSGAECSITWKT